MWRQRVMCVGRVEFLRRIQVDLDVATTNSISGIKCVGIKFDVCATLFLPNRASAVIARPSKKRKLLKTVSRVETFKNGNLAYRYMRLEGRKRNFYENADSRRTNFEMERFSSIS